MASRKPSTQGWHFPQQLCSWEVGEKKCGGQAAQSLREGLQGGSGEARQGGASSQAAPGDAPELQEAPRCTQEEVRGDLSLGLAGQGPPSIRFPDYPQPWPWPSSCDPRGESAPSFLARLSG